MASENPLQEYLTEKTAGFMDAMRAAGEGAKGALKPGGIAESAVKGGLHVAGGLAVAGAGVAAQRAYDAATKARDFRVVLEANPDLAEKHQENPRLFNQMFSTLRTMNPTFSRDPTVAGTYMRQMLSSPEHAGEHAVAALDYRDKLKSPFMQAFSRGKK